MAQYFSDYLPNWYVRWIATARGPETDGFSAPGLMWRFIDDNADPIVGSAVSGRLDNISYQSNDGGWSPKLNIAFNKPYLRAFNYVAEGYTLPVTVVGLEIIREDTSERVWYQDLVSPVTLTTSNPSEASDDRLYFDDIVTDADQDISVSLVEDGLTFATPVSGVTPKAQMSWIWYSINNNAGFVHQYRYLDLLDTTGDALEGYPYQTVRLSHVGGGGTLDSYVMPDSATSGTISNTGDIWIPVPAGTIRYWKLYDTKTVGGFTVEYEIARGQFGTDIVASAGQLVKFNIGDFGFSMAGS